MYPLAPFHNLPRLHALIKDDCPPVYPSLYAAWREIVPAVWKQISDPTYHVKRVLPTRGVAKASTQTLAHGDADSSGWVAVCHSASLKRDDVLRYDHGRETYAVCRDAADRLYALDGICTHGNVHLAGGLVKEGILECPNHNGRFRLQDGSPARTPICRGLTTYPVEERDGIVRINVRIATPPPGQACSPGLCSSYLFSLKPGDPVKASGPFGDFHIRPTLKEMVYIGGGAGMAPLRAHISHLLETERSLRRISFWYGARSGQEMFYESYFRDLERDHTNFSFHPALSSPMEGEVWEGHCGFIHDVVREHHLQNHRHAASIEYYACGPPMMMKAVSRLLADFGIPPTQITFDEF